MKPADPAPVSLWRRLAWRTTVADRSLSAASQAGFMNNLNDGLAWGLLPIVQASAGLSVGEIGLLAAAYPATWGLTQVATGALSDRIGREWVWTVACAGFAICYAALIALEETPSLPLLYVMVVSQGFLGYAATSVMGPIVVEIFEGPNYGAIFGTVTVALAGGGAAGPWAAGAIHDATGSYRLAFLLAIACCIVSAVAIWMAAPRKVRHVPGHRRRA